MWSIYCDTARGWCDIEDEGDDPQGAIGSNWQPGYTEEEARAFLAEHLAQGWGRGRWTNPRF